MYFTMAAWRRARRRSCSRSSALAAGTRLRRLSTARCSSSGLRAACGRRAASRYMSCSSMRPSRARASSSPRAFSNSATSESRTGRPSTTARIRSTTAAPARTSRTSTSAASTASERMADGEVQVVGLRVLRPVVELVPPVESERAHRALVAQAQARGVAQVAQTHVGDERVDVARFREGRHPERAEQVPAQLDTGQQQRVAAVRPHLVHPEPAQRIVAAGEEAVRLGHEELFLAEGPGQPDAAGEGHEHAGGEELVGGGLDEPLHKRVPSEHAVRDDGVGEQEVAPPRVERIVARVVHEGGGGPGERARAELAAEGEAVLGGLEGARLLVGLTQDEAPVPRQRARGLQGEAGAHEVEGLAVLLLAEPGDEQLLLAAQEIRLAEGGQEAEGGLEAGAREDG